MSEWSSNVYKSLIYTGIILLLISFFTSGKTTIRALTAGYSAVGLGLLLIIGSTQTTTPSIYKLFVDCLPVWLMIFIIGFILFLTIKYYTIISESRVSSSYFTFSNIIIILFLAQVYIMNKNNFELNGFDIGMLGILSIGVIQFIVCLLVLYVILRYYTTDGFRNY
jgi:hypothetical protein